MKGSLDGLDEAVGAGKREHARSYRTEKSGGQQSVEGFFSQELIKF